jgi:maltose O-acetyltransferase
VVFVMLEQRGRRSKRSVVFRIRQIFLLTIQDILRIFWDIPINVIANSVITPRALRILLYRLFGMKVEAINISPKCYFKTRHITIGRGTFINRACFFDNKAEIRIGNNCSIAMEVMFCTSTHNFGPATQRAAEVIQAPIHIGNGCWIGTRAVILPGITIGDGCIIAAGSIVTNDCEPNGLYAGVPARRIKDLA